MKNLSQPYYISAMPARLRKSTLQPSSVESTQARQDDSRLAAVFTHINYVVHELKLSPTQSGKSGALLFVDADRDICQTSAFTIHRPVLIFESSSVNKSSSSGGRGPADILSG